jgi:inosose dehydratase
LGKGMAICIATAPVSWGILEFEGQSSRQSWESVLDEMAEAGYSGTELGPYGFLPTNSDALLAALKSRGLKLLSAFVPVRLWQPEAQEAGLAAARQVGALLAACQCQHIVISDDNAAHPARLARAGRIGLEDGLDDAGWHMFSAGLDKLAACLRSEFGLRTAFHHHCAGFVETPEEVDRLLEMTDPDLVGLCLDTGHYAYGGGDPLDCVRRHGPRVTYLHLKDLDAAIAARARTEAWNYFTAVAAGLFCELGQGSVDFPTLLRAVADDHFEGWAVVEQDLMPGTGAGTPLESARRNRAYLRQLGV